MPAVVLYTFLGHSLAEGALGHGSFARAMIVGAVIVAMSFLPSIVKRVRR